MPPYQIPVYFHPDQLLFHPKNDWDQKGLLEHPESPKRARSILKTLEAAPKDFAINQPVEIPEYAIQQVHRLGMLQMYQTASKLPEDKPFYPTHFPKVNQRKADPTNIHHAGFYCIDTSTPLYKDTWTSAAWSAASGYDAAKALLEDGHKLTYGLCRPPGHHADHKYFGGYCYLNNAAVAAQALGEGEAVAILDIDYHHGDGTQSIFYYDNKVLYISVHADPTTEYPYYSGYKNETGLEVGLGYTLNVPLPSGTTGEVFTKAIKDHVLPKLKEFNPKYLIISAGMDTYRLDPMGNFKLEIEDFFDIGDAIGSLNIPTAVVQEGGYCVADLGACVQSFLLGLRSGMQLN